MAGCNPGRATALRGRSRPAVTLLELLLTLAMMVMIGALALPAMRGPFASQRLRKAGELVRVEWTKAAVQAMKTGQIQMFQFQPGDRFYSVQPYFTEQDWLEADAAHTAGGVGGSGLGGSLPAGTGQSTVTGRVPAAGEAGDSLDPTMRQLPEGVFFVGGRVQMDARSLQIQEATSGVAGAADQEAPRILFYPDGTTSDAEIVLANEYQVNVRVTLRSLTGIAKVSSLLSFDELQQIQQQVR